MGKRVCIGMHDQRAVRRDHPPLEDAVEVRLPSQA
jgi:hypothetical protein